MPHFRYPDASSDRPCWTCEHVAGEIAGGLHALCLEGGRKYVQAIPERGCVHWIRAVGADDEELPNRSRPPD